MIMSCGMSNIRSKEPCTHQKGPCIHSKQLCILSKEPCIHSKEPYIHPILSRVTWHVKLTTASRHAWMSHATGNGFLLHGDESCHTHVTTRECVMSHTKCSCQTWQRHVASRGMNESCHTWMSKVSCQTREWFTSHRSRRRSDWENLDLEIQIFSEKVNLNKRKLGEP